MGRHSGYIALGTAYGRPDIILVPEHALDLELLVERVKHLYDLQKNVVIVCGDGPALWLHRTGNGIRPTGYNTRAGACAGPGVVGGTCEAPLRFAEECR